MSNPLQRTVERAERLIEARYVALCDEAGEVLNPRDLGLASWAEDLLDGVYETLLIERSGGLWND